MLPYFKPILQFISVDRVRVDSNISRLHYLVTGLVLVGYSILLTSKVVVSDSIVCHSWYKSENAPSERTLNSLCFTSSSDITTSHHETTTSHYEETTTSHTPTIPIYYQYQALVFFLMAFGFYAPKFMYDMIEGGITEKVVQQLSEPILEQSEREKQLKQLSLYIKRHFGNHHILAFCYFLTDLMYLMNLIIQAMVLNKVFSGFMTYGIEVNTSMVFPKSAVCLYSDESMEHKIKATCMLPLNYLSDKFCLVLYWWFMVLGISTCCLILHHIFFICSTMYRNHVLCLKGGKYWKKNEINRIFQGLNKSEVISEAVFLQMIIQNLSCDTALELLNLL